MHGIPRAGKGRTSVPWSACACAPVSAARLRAAGGAALSGWAGAAAPPFLAVPTATGVRCQQRWSDNRALISSSACSQLNKAFVSSLSAQPNYCVLALPAVHVAWTPVSPEHGLGALRLITLLTGAPTSAGAVSCRSDGRGAAGRMCR